MEELGYCMNGKERQVLIYQYNESNIRMMEVGPPCNSNSKHVRIRTFYGLTKPLQGAKYDIFADEILGDEQ